MTSCRGDSQNTDRLLFYISACCVYKGSDNEADASFLYIGVNLFCLFFGNRVVTLIHTTY